MTNWFICKISYDKLADNGAQKKVTEEYLVDALSYAEAEARIIEEVEPYISGDFAVSGIRRAHFSELFPGNGDGRFFRVKVNLITLDERTGRYKHTALQMLVEAGTPKEAIDILNTNMNMMVDYEISSVTESSILGIFPCKEGKEAAL